MELDNYFAKTRRVISHYYIYFLFVFLVFFIALLISYNFRAIIISFIEISGLFENTAYWHLNLWLMAFYTLYIFIFLSLILLYTDGLCFTKYKKIQINRNAFYTIMQGFLLLWFCSIIVLTSLSTKEAIWFDEAITLLCVRLPFRQMLDYAINHDICPPLYFIMLKLFSFFVNNNLTLFKLFSSLPILLTVGSVILMFRKELSDKGVVFFLLCCIANDWIIYMSYNMRFYSWALFFVNLSMLFLWKALQTNTTRHFILYLFFAECAAWTHYYAALEIGIITILVMIFSLKYYKKEAKKLLITIICALPTIVLLLFFAKYQIKEIVTVQNQYLPSATLTTSLDYFYKYFLVSEEIVRINIFTRIIFIIFLVSLGCYIVKKKTYFLLFIGVVFSSIPITYCLLSGIGLFHPKIPYVDRYFFPFIVLVWLLFTVSITPDSKTKNKALVKFFMAACLILVFSGSITFIKANSREIRKGLDYEMFYNYCNRNIRSNDIFVFPVTGLFSEHLAGVISYLYPDNSIVYNNFYFPRIYSVFSHQETSLDELFDNYSLYDRPAWLIVDLVFGDNEGASLEIKPDSNKVTYCGEFGWNVHSNAYHFVMLYTKSLADFIKAGDFIWSGPERNITSLF